MAKRVSNVSVVAKTYNGKVESLESLIRRFKRKCDKAGVVYDIKKREYYLKPTEKRKLKEKLAYQRKLKEERKNSIKLNTNDSDK